jgi:hypothetical protein
MAVNPEQLQLDDMPIGRNVHLESSRRGLLPALTPEFNGLDLRDYDVVTDKLRSYTHPDKLLSSLLYIPIGTTTSASYLPKGSRSPVVVALTPDEFTLLPRSPEALSDSVRNRTRAARPKGDKHTSAAERSVVYAHIGKVASVETYLQETLIPWNELLNKFITNAQYPHLSHFGGEAQFRIEFEVLMTQILGNFLDALKIQRGWNDEQYELVRKTIEARLFIDGQQKDRVERFSHLLKSIHRYEAHKTALFVDRLHTSKEIAESRLDEF